MDTLSVDNPVGFALCCGLTPEIRGGGQEALCGICGRKQGVWGGLVFLRSCWNKQFMVGQGHASVRAEHKEMPVPILYKREGWVECDVHLDFARFGHTSQYRVESCLFRTPMRQIDMWYAGDESGYSCAIEEGRHIHDIELEHPAGRTVRLQWQDGKRYPYSYVYCHTGWCTDGTYSCGINVCNARVKDNAAELFAWLGDERKERG